MSVNSLDTSDSTKKIAPTLTEASIPSRHPVPLQSIDAASLLAIKIKINNDRLSLSSDLKFDCIDGRFGSYVLTGPTKSPQKSAS